jgi:hypothetical protein
MGWSSSPTRAAEIAKNDRTLAELEALLSETESQDSEIDNNLVGGDMDQDEDTGDGAPVRSGRGVSDEEEDGDVPLVESKDSIQVRLQLPLTSALTSIPSSST